MQERATPNKMKMKLKPAPGLELRWRMKVMSEIPSAPPTVLNMPRSPTMVATFSGINSIQALFAAGLAIPAPIPQKRIRNASVSVIPHRNSIILMSGTPGDKRIVAKETMPRPNTKGHR